MTSEYVCGRRRLAALVAVAYVLTISAHIPQHRVKHPSKATVYRHITTQTQKARVVPIYGLENIPKVTQTLDTARHWKEIDQSWHLHCDASLVSPESALSSKRRIQARDKIRRRSSQIIGDMIDASSTTSLNEQTVNTDFGLSQESSDSQNSTNKWNVSTHFEANPDNVTISGSTSSSNAYVIFSSSTTPGVASEQTYQPIRIRIILTETSWLTADETSILFNDFLPPAVLAWSAALRVDPVIGNLTIDANQLYDGETCGPGKDSMYPSVKVPLDHLNDGIGIPDTDLVIYLSLSFWSEQDKSNTRNYSDVHSTQIDSNINSAKSSVNGTSPLEYQSNLTDALFGDDVGGTNFLENNNPADISTKPMCSGEYLAAATYCSTDQYDRPTAAMLHLCIHEETFFSNVNQTIVTIMHEIGHALGFNPQSMAHFRDKDGLPLTERDSDGNVADVAVTCSGVGEQTQIVPLPSTDILRFRRVRDGVRVAEIVTPTVQQVTRNHFDCQYLQGAELESGLAETGGSCLGDHWERLLFREDIMNPVVDDVPFTLRISPITLALFADSGWYQVDLSRAAPPAGWGRRAGCPFVNDTCISSDGGVSATNTAFFCNNAGTMKGSDQEFHGCSPDMTRKATCNIDSYDSELPLKYQYFRTTLGPNAGGQEGLMDYCPVFTGFSNGECSSKETKEIFQVARFEEFGIKQSRCLSGSIQGASTALCLAIACVVEDRTLRIKLDGEWKICHHAGQELFVSTGTVAICPDPVRACPTFFCNRDCLGTGGVCDFASGDCLCSVPVFNSTAPNATVLVACHKVNNYSNVQPFFDVVVQENALPVDPSLSDYYVSSPQELRNDRVSIFGTVGIILVSSGVFVVLVFLFVGSWGYFNQQKRAYSDSSDIPNEIEVPRRNKDKFVASLLFNLRLQNPLPQEDVSVVSALETMSETDCSFNESSARFSTVSISTCSQGDPDEVVQRGDPTVDKQDEETQQVNIIRRRFNLGNEN